MGIQYIVHWKLDIADLLAPFVPDQCVNLICQQRNFILRLHGIEAGCTEAVREALAAIVQIFRGQNHRLALAQQNRK